MSGSPRIPAVVARSGIRPPGGGVGAEIRVQPPATASSSSVLKEKFGIVSSTLPVVSPQRSPRLISCSLNEGDRPGERRRGGRDVDVDDLFARGVASDE